MSACFVAVGLMWLSALLMYVLGAKVNEFRRGPAEAALGDLLAKVDGALRRGWTEKTEAQNADRLARALLVWTVRWEPRLSPDLQGAVRSVRRQHGRWRALISTMRSVEKERLATFARSEPETRAAPEERSG